MTVDRVELHALVWSEPMQRLAKRFGLSDVALAKRCRKLNVPVPGRGYWARKAAGKRGRIRPLPPARHGEGSQMTELVEVRDAEVEGVAHDGPVWEQGEFEAQAENRIVVGRRRSQTPVIQATAAVLARFRGTSSSAAVTLHRGVLDIRVAGSNVARPLRLMDAFVGACLRRGFLVQPNGGERGESVVVVHGQAIELCLVEHQRRIDLTKDERGRPLPDAERIYPRYRFEYTGEFELRLGHRYGIARSTRKDGKRQRFEDRLKEARLVEEVEEGLWHDWEEVAPLLTHEPMRL